MMFFELLLPVTAEEPTEHETQRFVGFGRHRRLYGQGERAPKAAI